MPPSLLHISELGNNGSVIIEVQNLNPLVGHLTPACASAAQVPTLNRRRSPPRAYRVEQTPRSNLRKADLRCPASPSSHLQWPAAQVQKDLQKNRQPRRELPCKAGHTAVSAHFSILSSFITSSTRFVLACVREMGNALCHLALPIANSLGAPGGGQPKLSRKAETGQSMQQLESQSSLTGWFYSFSQDWRHSCDLAPRPA